MKEYLVDVPVRINIWIRSECQKKQFEIIKQARPSILFITSDGGRNEHEWEIIQQNRKLYDEGIDWDCTVYKLYAETNLGMYAMTQKRHEFVWSKVDRCIMLEDDVLPSVSFFQFCAEMLEKYKDDLRVNVICGLNHLGVFDSVNSDYFFSRQGSIWGFAMWRRTYEQYYDFSYGNDSYVMNLLKQQTKKNPIFWKRIKAYVTESHYEGHVASTEFFLEFGVYGQHQLQIVPKYNLINNIGYTDSTHFDELEKMPPWLRRLFNMKTYELEFPLTHAKYVIPDETYEKKRNKIIGYNYPLGRVRALLYRIIKLDFKYLYKRFKDRKKIVIER